MIRNWKTRRHIIEQSAPIFNKKGYVGTSISDLTKATGLSKGSIYGNFEDKDEVAIEAFRYNFKTQAKWFLKHINKAEKTYDKLKANFVLYRTEYDTFLEHGGCPILNTAADSDDVNPRLKKEVRRALEGWMDHLTQIIEEGMEKGELKPVDPKKFAHRMISLIEGGVLMSITLDDRGFLMQNLDMLERDIDDISII